MDSRRKSVIENGRRFQVLALMMAFIVVGLAACETDTAGSEAGADIGDLRDRVAGLEQDLENVEERVGELEATDTADEGVPGPDEALAVDDVYAEPESYVGQQVTVSAEVGEILGTNAFTLTGPTQPLLIVSATGVGDSPVVEPSAPVQVTGTVREGFDVVSFEEEAGVELDDELFTDFEGEIYIEASSVSEPQTDTEETTG